MNPVKRPLILRVGVVLFAISLMGGYVVFSQNQAKPRVVRGTKSAPVMEGHGTLDASVNPQAFQTAQSLEQKQEVAAARNNGVVMPSSKLGLVFKGVRLIDPAGEPLRSEEDEEEEEVVAAPSAGDTAFLSTKSGAPLLPPQIIQLRPSWLTPATSETKETIQLQQTSRVSAFGSKSLVPVISQDAILQPSASQNSAAHLPAPGSKVLVPIFRVPTAAEAPSKQEQSK